MNLHSAEVAADRLLCFVSRVSFAVDDEEMVKLSEWLIDQAINEDLGPLKKFFYDSAEFVRNVLGERT